MNIENSGILNPIPGYPNGYVTKDGMWAAVPLINSKKFVIIHNGQQVHVANNYKFAKSYIQKSTKSASVSNLEKFYE
jgi:hypothetical protein